MLQNMGISSVFIDVGKEAVAHYTPCSIREMELWLSITAVETERELYSTVPYSLGTPLQADAIYH